jgi:hypothetical protein
MKVFIHLEPGMKSWDHSLNCVFLIQKQAYYHPCIITVIFLTPCHIFPQCYATLLKRQPPFAVSREMHIFTLARFLWHLMGHFIERCFKFGCEMEAVMTYYSGMYKNMQKKSKQLKITPFSTQPSQTPVILHCLVTITAFSQKHRHHCREHCN